MRLKVTTATAVLALVAGSLPFATAALAATGGATAPTETKPASGASAVHPTGIATWFGPGFYGHKTACGQTLTPAVEGVANRTLPCGTLIKVAYRGRTLTVPVLDRGPYSHIGADWDLTAGAAEKLGITETVRIRTSVVGKTANTPALGSPPAEQTATLAGGAVAG